MKKRPKLSIRQVLRPWRCRLHPWEVPTTGSGVRCPTCELAEWAKKAKKVTDEKAHAAAQVTGSLYNVR